MIAGLILVIVGIGAIAFALTGEIPGIGTLGLPAGGGGEPTSDVGRGSPRPGFGPGFGVPTPRAAAFSAVVKVRFPGLRSLGICSCRKIIPHSGGTSPYWSEHSWCNAEDWTGSAADMAALMAFARRNRSRFGIVNVIGPGPACNCVHIDYAPNHAGQVPPCARRTG